MGVLRGLLHELRNESRAQARSRHHVGRKVFAVRYFRMGSFHHPLVQRQPPNPLMRPGCRGFQGFCQFVVFRQQPRIVVAERMHTSSGKRGDAYHGFRGIAVGNVRGEISEHQSSFRVGMMNFHGKPVLGTHDIQRFERAASEEVFHQSYGPHGRTADPALVQVPKCRDRRGSPRHIRFHIRHGLVRLDLQSAGIERDPFSDNGKIRGDSRNGIPFENHDRSGYVGSVGYREQHSESLFPQFVRFHCPDGRGFPRKTLDDVGKLPGILVVRRHIDQIPGQVYGLDFREQFGRYHMGALDEFEGSRFLFLGQVRRKAIRSERETENRFVAIQRISDEQPGRSFETPDRLRYLVGQGLVRIDAEDGELVDSLELSFHRKGFRIGKLGSVQDPFQKIAPEALRKFGTVADYQENLLLVESVG